MNDLQRTILDMLRVFVDICGRLHLNYFLVCGSALGAVKYEGFIPWDDDVDVALYREDYERFLREAPTLLPPHLSLQNLHTEEAFPLLMTKLRNSNTTLVEASYEHLPINHGAFIDIFPLDGLPAGKAARCVFQMKKWVYNKARCVAYIYGYKFFRLHKIMLAYERLLKKYPCEGSEWICNHANWQRELEYVPPSRYGQGTTATFEGMEVRIPEQYDEYLTLKYNDWRRDPPVDRCKSHHIFMACDMTRPYTDYFREIAEVEQHGKE